VTRRVDDEATIGAPSRVSRVPLIVRGQVGLFLTVAFLPGALIGGAFAESVLGARFSEAQTVAAFAFGLAAQFVAARVADRVWPSLAGQGWLRVGGAGPVGPGLAALLLALSAALRQDEIVAFPVLVFASAFAITWATYATLRNG
jgi:hypothetical protein